MGQAFIDKFEYETLSGMAARFTTAAGDDIRIEPREKSVVLAWNDDRGVGAVLDYLDTRDDKLRFLVARTRGKPRRLWLRGRLLSRYLNHRRARLRLVRYAFGNGQRVTWEAASANGRPEVAVSANTWKEAQALARDLGASEVSKRVPHLLTDLA